MSELPYNRSLLITNRGWIPNSYNYRCPSEFAFRGISVKQVIINNPPTISSHSFRFLAYPHGNSPPIEENVELPESNSTPETYIKDLVELIKTKVQPYETVELHDTESDFDTVSVSNAGDGKIHLTGSYNSQSKTFTLRFMNRTPSSFKIKLSDVMRTYLGFPAMSDADGFIDLFPGMDDLEVKSNTAASLYPRYYLVRSSSLAGYGFTENNDRQSDIIAIVPHGQTAYPCTVWENQETHLHTLFFDKGELHNTIDLRFYVEENEFPIYDPSFLITFVTTG